MSVHLDPREVLEHLQCLGYYNVTGEQLKEFMRDLKKLIKYDQIKSQKGSSSLHRETRGHHSPQRNKCHNPGTSAQVEDQNVIIEPNECEVEPEVEENYYKDNCCECCDKHNDNDEYEEKCCCMNKKPSTKRPALRKENIPPRPPSSFIRPCTKASNSSKCDPVARFHHYQNLWAQQKFPGEDPRTDLRWNIRHRMMGQQPCDCQCCCCAFMKIWGNELYDKCNTPNEPPKQIPIKNTLVTSSEKFVKSIKVSRASSVERFHRGQVRR